MYDISCLYKHDLLIARDTTLFVWRLYGFCLNFNIILLLMVPIRSGGLQPSWGCDLC